MSTTTENIDLIDDLKSRAATLTYPAKPDGRGSARVNWLRHPYYFGKHNTLESYMLFGEWRRHLIETGEAMDMKSVRRNLAILREEVLDQDPVEEPSEQEQTSQSHGSFLAIACITCGLLIGVLLFAVTEFSSTPSVPTVDGLALTPEETEIIRGVREHQNHASRPRSDDPKRMADTLQELMERGPINGKLHGKGKGL